MIDINKHKFFLVQVLKEIYADLELANYLGFKGGTALMLFHELPRFSVDLDFDLLDSSKKDAVYTKIRQILLKHGQIKDEAKKHYSLLLVLDYGSGQRNLKVEISERKFPNTYELVNYLGITVKAMTLKDLFSHKLVALLDRTMMTSRDIYDCWYLMDKRTPLNPEIIMLRTNLTVEDYLTKCIQALSKVKNNKLLDGLGELMDEKQKSWIKQNLLNDLLKLIEMYKKFPIF